MIDEILKKLEIPENSSIPITDAEARFVFDFVKRNGLKKTAETGCGYGKSAVSIMAATGVQHIVIDPFQSNYQYGGINNIENVGFVGALNFFEDYSHSVLPRLLEQGERLDFIFIDGNHRFDGQFIDFYYADLMLDQNGYILFHDTWMRSTAHMESYIRANRRDYISIDTGLRNLALFKKVDRDTRKWMHFKGFATLKSLVSHSIMEWLDGEETVAQRIARKIKSKLKL